ncbi:TetR/AcrR family transcriptional regulator [uncultured Williamsia sp.]|uniref:TetR/AcrR family transcriptional regulator n=1 Tax=uncultured Williamsia sp. TaxID=259311 RepID=UPI002631663A|nr:TetR/AcrR family transcriptional regulator [uncultured Williamsia sp.]
MVNTGRPRDSSIDDAILDEAARMVVENGYGATTIDAVARAAGTTRPAVYRRYASLAQIVSAAMSSRLVFAPAVDSGDLPTDLRRIQQAQVAFFTDPLVVKALPGLIEESSRNETLRTRLLDDVMAPRRAAVATAIDQAAARGEIEVGHNVEHVADLLIGPLMLRTLLPALGAVDEGLVATTVAAALHAVHHRGGLPRDAGVGSAE